MTRLLAIALLIISAQVSKAQVYGESFEISNPISKMELGITENESLQIQGVIEETCQMKGCWMNIVTEDQQKIRVTFKDYGFFVPKEGVNGKKAVMSGELFEKMTSVEDLRHYAEDAGKSKDYIASITEPKKEFTFVASGVIIQD